MHTDTVQDLAKANAHNAASRPSKSVQARADWLTCTVADTLMNALRQGCHVLKAGHMMVSSLRQRPSGLGHPYGE